MGIRTIKPTTSGNRFATRSDFVEITAMMRTTGYSLAATAYLQSAGVIPRGVHTPSECIPAEAYIQQLAERGIVIERSET
ncbi:MAG TPA: hypothetical protein EYO83_02020 [Gemmatimonadetes bacterium]|nr:hypothetical protein [Gemmatimonadota bacterium]